MPVQSAADILNELLSHEQMNFPRRLLDSTVFVSGLSVEDLNLVERMARAGDEHSAGLTHLILRLGGVPSPRTADPSVADLHFQELRSVLPRLIADRENLVRKYSLSLQRLNAEPQAVKLLQGVLDRHRQELAFLQRRGGYNVGVTRS